VQVCVDKPDAKSLATLVGDRTSKANILDSQLCPAV
jgi:hypothetical protein